MKATTAATDNEGTGDAATLFARAADRARAAGLPYAGAVTPAEAFALAQAGAATIVDIRTRPEWEFVGRIPDAPLVEWRAWGETSPHPGFVDEVRRLAGPETPLLLLCRSGVRSHNAATRLAQEGFGRAYNILQGFEGDPDEHGQRGKRGGWRHAGLPWTQG